MLNLYLAAAEFFEGPQKALPLMRAFGETASDRECRLEYDYLFRGCDADFCPPLWASVCKEDKVLNNATTLEVIQFCHRWGYEPRSVDFNPKDYIGEQFSFLAYLTTKGEYDDDASFAAEEFLHRFTLDNIRDLCEAVEKRGTFASILRILQVIRMGAAGFLREVSDAGLLMPQEEDPFAHLADLPVVPIADAPAVTINTAGINNCGGKCVLRPTVQEGCLLRIESDESSNSPQIRACLRGRSYRKTYYSPQRLRYPMKRAGKRGSGRFERISWEEAADLISSQWIRIRDTYGPQSRFSNYSTGVTGVFRPSSLTNRLLALDGGYLDFFNSYSSAQVAYMTPYIYGTATIGSSPQQLLNAKLVVFWGDNSAETIIGTEKNYYMSQLKSRGIQVICIDPRMSQTAVAYADEWVPIRPASDAALADAIAWVLWSENLQDQAFMDKYCIGFDEDHMPEGIPAGESYKSYIFGAKDGIEKTPAWASAICGIPEETIFRLARLMGTVKPATIVAGYGPQRHRNGEQNAKGVCTLACMTGNVGIPGGNAGSILMTKEHTTPANRVAPVKNPVTAKIPSFLWTKAIDRPEEIRPREDRLKGAEKLESGIKMLFNIAGNILINQHSDINDTMRVLSDESKCEFILCTDVFMTPSARWADVLLPGACVFEQDNFVAPWRGNNFVLRNNKVVEPLFESRFEWEWLKEVAKRLGLYEEFTAGMPDSMDWLKENYRLLRLEEPELPDWDTFTRLGGWQYSDQISFIAFEKEIADPQHHKFPTPSGKIEIFSKALYDFGQEDIPAIPRYVSCSEGPDDPLRAKYPLQLIGWHTRRRCHSIHDNNEWLDEIEMPGVWIHPQDAAQRGIANGDLVNIYNDRGCVRIPAIVTTRIAKGVAAMSQGGWFTPDEKGVDTRGSINVLTGMEPSPLAKGNPQHTNLVQIEKA
ncbi:MAG: molybdopterin-dependent oxidoreductase [Firmicutes bacterium]|nr:molybdopterin-dependent oxidoreductase [Bacillota bacterium]